MIPFSPEVFFALFEEYNLAIWPAQFAAYALGLLVLILAVRPSRVSSGVIGAILAALWMWNGVAYHWFFFAPINFSAPVFAGFFILQALLLLWKFVIQRDAMIGFRRDAPGITGLTLMIVALAGYPLLANVADHGGLQSAVFGVAPTPTVIFTLGVLLLARPRAPLVLMIVPLLWSVIGGLAVWLVGIPEDVVLPVAGVLAVNLVLWQRRGQA
ncbi:MAG: DUF6064 family protein [Hyphomicrobiaceae bacterium]|nr:DUF6064 family protein [Hyphomicrobiaceae bacterium]